MATSTDGDRTCKIIRIQDNEKELLFQLREIYKNDYRKYYTHIIQESNIPISIKRIYNLLDERQAYRRISDYFHRKRIVQRTRSSRSNDLNRSYHPSSTRHITQISGPMHVRQVNNEMYDVHQQSDSSTMTDDNEELIDENAQEMQPSLSINSTHQQNRRLSLINNRQQQPVMVSVSQSCIRSKSDLLSVRASVQKALRELNRVIISKPDTITEDYNDEQQRLSIQITNDHCHSNFDDIVRSLSNVVNQQQENVRLIINESSALLIDNNKLSPTTQESIQHTLERLNTLVDRGHSIYDRIENILT